MNKSSSTNISVDIVEPLQYSPHISELQIKNTDINSNFHIQNIIQHHEKITTKLDYFYKTNKIPNIIIYGSNGTGKKTILSNFINKIYQNDKHKIKSNVMIVNCAHGKGIKFIREDLKLFAKTNIQSNNGVLFKSIVLLNADFLTIDAQSALRRCIELFSHTTRFFIVIENKNKLLNPILSRFCTIYVPDFIIDGNITNLHKYILHKKYPIDDIETIQNNMVTEKLDTCFKNKSNNFSNNSSNLRSPEVHLSHRASCQDISAVTLQQLNEITCYFYENGLSCLQIIHWIKNTQQISNLNKTNIIMQYHKIRREFRCEKMLMFNLLCIIKNNIIIE
jgi:hypothetical protein